MLGRNLKLMDVPESAFGKGCAIAHSTHICTHTNCGLKAGRGLEDHCHLWGHRLRQDSSLLGCKNVDIVKLWFLSVHSTTHQLKYLPCKSLLACHVPLPCGLKYCPLGQHLLHQCTSKFANQHGHPSAHHTSPTKFVFSRF